MRNSAPSGRIADSRSTIAVASPPSGSAILRGLPVFFAVLWASRTTIPLRTCLASLRVRREWFDIGPDLIRFLDENILPWPEHLPSEDEVVAAREGCELDPCSFVEAMVLSGRPPHRLRLEWPKPDVNPEGRVPIQALARGFPEIRSYLLRTHRPPGSRREPTDEELLAMAAMP